MLSRRSHLILARYLFGSPCNPGFIFFEGKTNLDGVLLWQKNSSNCGFRTGSSGNRGRDPCLFAIEMSDQRKNRIGQAMQEFHTDIEVLAILALPGPFDLAVHSEGLAGSFKVNDDLDDVADGKILIGADPGPGHGDILGIGIDPAVRSGFRSLVPVPDENAIPFPESLVLPIFHIGVLGS
jgi:hypothetical protein